MAIAYRTQYSFCVVKASVSARQLFFCVKNGPFWMSLASLLLRYCPFEKLALYQVIAYGKREEEGEECTCQSIDTERRGYRGRCYLLEEQRRSDIPEKADGKSIPQHATSPLISDNFRLESSLWTKCNIQHLERALYRKYIHWLFLFFFSFYPPKRTAVGIQNFWAHGVHVPDKQGSGKGRIS